MLAWTLAILCFAEGLRLLSRDLMHESGLLAHALGAGRENRNLRQVSGCLRELEETLGAGLVPEKGKWEKLRQLPPPWGALSHDSIQELRKCGGALLPTLRRIRELADSHAAALIDAKARSSQALAQALACGALVPLFGGALYLLLPGIEFHILAWVLINGAALALSGAGALWLLALSERARWGGLDPELRPWVLAAQCAGERFVALVRAGNPADRAWTQACELLSMQTPELALEWGYSIWNSGLGATKLNRTGSAASLIQAGVALRKAVQVSLMEGRPCTERAEAALVALRHELAAQVDRELSLLSTRALKPLFLCVAPALFGLLGSGLWLCWKDVGL